VTMFDPVDLITQAVTERLIDAEFTLDFEPTRPDYLEIEPTDHALHVTVFPRSEIAESWWTQDTDQSEIAIAVVIRRHLETYDPAAVAALKQLAREIRNTLRNAHPITHLGDYPVNLESIAHDPLWAPELLRTAQLFLSILLVTYKTEYEV